jgi:nitroreductase
MNVYEAIHQRRTIHNYLPEPVDPAAVDRILAAGHMAPNHKLTWPWHFKVIGQETRASLVPIAFRLKNATDPSIQKRIEDKLLSPGALIVVTQTRCEDAFREKENYAATCCAIQNILLAAKSEGLGSKWSTGALTQHPDICTLLEVDLKKESVAGFIWLGTAKNEPKIDRPELKAHITVLP